MLLDELLEFFYDDFMYFFPSEDILLQLLRDGFEVKEETVTLCRVPHLHDHPLEDVMKKLRGRVPLVIYYIFSSRDAG